MAGCATSNNKEHLPNARVLWVKDFETTDAIVVDRAQRKNISDKIALLIDSRYSHKFSAIYRKRPPEPGTSIVVTGLILDFGPDSWPDSDPGTLAEMVEEFGPEGPTGGPTDILSTWMTQFDAGKITIDVTVIDAATGEKLIGKTRINYPLYQEIDLFGWTEIEQTVNVAAENIAAIIERLKIKKPTSVMSTL